MREKETASALASYTPKTPGRIDDLAVAAADILRQLPDVVQVDIPMPVQRPASRIVHLRDWHFVPKDLYALDLRSAAGKPLSDAEIDTAHEELVLEAEIVQQEQLALLRCLIRHHGLRRVFSEGLSKQDPPSYRARINALREAEKRRPALQAAGRGAPASATDGRSRPGEH